MKVGINFKTTFIGLFLLFLAGLFIPIPDPLFDKSYATVLESEDGQLLGARIAPDGQWRFPPTDSLPTNYITCLLEFEDRYFYSHPGINLFSIIRAVRQNIDAGTIVSGGSTITMQIARMALGNKPRTISQKLLELWLALRIEIKYSKDEIIKLYANNAPFGGNVVGISAAAWRYYGRSEHLLSWAEAANLAVLPNAPGLVFPGTNESELKAKRNRILANLVQNSVIDKTNYHLSLNEPLPGKPKRLPESATHLLNRSIDDGFAETIIKTTLNNNLQSAINQIVNDYYLIYKYKHINNAAAIVADIETGNVVAYVGNVGSNDPVDHGQQVDIINSRRSPGSLLKPILYALSIDCGIITPNQLLPDIPVYYQGFAPQNFDKKFKGAVPANLALRSSLNVPFVSLLTNYSYEQFHYDLKSLGIHSLDQPAGHYGLSIILGGGDVSLWEMAGLYAGMARNLKSFNSNKGEMRYEGNNFRSLNYLLSTNSANAEKSKESMVSASACWHMLKAMQELRRPDVESNWQQFGNSQSVAWKTGTSYGHKDAWAIGLNSEYVVGVWLGNADGEGRPDLTGVIAAAPLMFRIFETLDGEAIFQMPIADMEMIRICRQSGNKASDHCTEIDLLPISRNAKATPACKHHKLIHLDESDSYQVSSICYPVTKMHEKAWFILPPAQAWYYKKFNSNYSEPPDYLAECNPASSESIEMIYPKTFTKVFVPIEIDGKPGKVIFEAAHRNPEAKVFWYLDDTYVGETKQLHQMGLFPNAGSHQLSLVDEHGRELSVDFEAVNKRKL